MTSQPPSPPATGPQAKAAGFFRRKPKDAKDTKAPQNRRPAPGGRLGGLFAQEAISDDIVADERDVLRRHRRLMILVKTQAIAVGILSAILIFAAPIMRPYYIYQTVSPDHHKETLSPLLNPNMTNQAVLSWTATSITEIMTLGFGDFDQQLSAQRKRFTSRGWMSFLKAVAKQQIRTAFKKEQLILTTVPTDAPVIVAQGEDEEYGYRWIVELPVIMTYATNNNVTRKTWGVARLIIVRVPAKDSIGGIAIDKWEIG